MGGIVFCHLQNPARPILRLITVLPHRAQQDGEADARYERVREAGRLVTASQWRIDQRDPSWSSAQVAPVVVPDALMNERRWAVLFVDAGQREAFFAEAMHQGTLESKLVELEGRGDRTPVDELLLFEGWSRLSKFERASGAADRLLASYPGDGDLARRVLSLHRSLNGLETSHGAIARNLVQRTAPALLDGAPLWTELGEMEEDRGQSAAAMEVTQVAACNRLHEVNERLARLSVVGAKPAGWKIASLAPVPSPTTTAPERFAPPL